MVPSSPCTAPAQAAARVSWLPESPTRPFPSAWSHLRRGSLLICPGSHLSLLPPPKALLVGVQARLPGHQPVEDTLTRTRAKYLSPPPKEPLRACARVTPPESQPSPYHVLRDPPSYQQLSGLAPAGSLLSFSHPLWILGGNWGDGADPREGPARSYSHTGSRRLLGTSLALLWPKTPGTSCCWSCCDGGGSFSPCPGMPHLGPRPRE